VRHSPRLGGRLQGGANVSGSLPGQPARPQPRTPSAVLEDVFPFPGLILTTAPQLRTFVVLGTLALALMLPGAAHAAGKRAPTASLANVVIDGPDAAISSLNGMAIARDGSGGLVYLKGVAGSEHVFVSMLSAGIFHQPVQVDGGLLTASSQPVIAAGNDGLLIVAFINNGELYVATTPGDGAPLSTPQALFAGAANPSVSLSNFGKAYLAFTATGGGGGGDVRTAYYYARRWALESSPLDVNPSDAAGLGSGRPEVATAGDGVAIVVWGEDGHIMSRRVVKTTPSVVAEQADPSTLDGWGEVSASEPVVSTGGDSSYANIAFQETFTSGSAQQSRVLANRLRGSQYDGVQEIDGETMGAGDGADQPATVSTEYGRGFITSERMSSHALYAATMTNDESVQNVFRVDTLSNAGAADAVPATAGLVSTLIAWQQNPGTSGPAEIRLRYAQDGSDLGPEQVVSTPALGATDADAGLVAAGDVAGDAAAAWVQGTGASTRIVAVQLFTPPGSFAASDSFHYATSAQPLLRWSPAAEPWGGIDYTVRLDGTIVAQTTATSARPDSMLSDGRHEYQLIATNLAGVTSLAPTATIFVDTVAPRLSLHLTGSRAVDSSVKAAVRYGDLPPRGLPRSDASGVALVTVAWGDGTPAQRIRRTSAEHVYTRARTYTVRITATDRAGNVTVLSRRIKITGHLTSAQVAHTPAKPGTTARVGLGNGQ
jgi:hypothetical protein